ncbi:hypothetical protein N431DRAFT_458701 [Stipitochalara longipes BDJ]|nr:hypothetical protein N431DRAFT_458701 [Stipitochalara longipes BDJ]
MESSHEPFLDPAFSRSSPSHSFTYVSTSSSILPQTELPHSVASKSTDSTFSNSRLNSPITSLRNFATSLKGRSDKSRSKHEPESNSSEDPLSERQATSGPRIIFPIVSNIPTADAEHPIASNSSYRQDREGVAFAHRGTSLRLGDGDVPESHSGLESRLRGGVDDEKKNLLYKVLNLPSSRRAALSSTSPSTGPHGTENSPRRINVSSVSSGPSMQGYSSKKLPLDDPDDADGEYQQEPSVSSESLTLLSSQLKSQVPDSIIPSNSQATTIPQSCWSDTDFGDEKDVAASKEKARSHEDPVGVGRQNSPASLQDPRKEIQLSTTLANSDDSKTEDSTSLKSTNTSRCSEPDNDVVATQDSLYNGYATDFSDESDELLDDSMAMTDAFASIELTGSLDIPGH